MVNSVWLEETDTEVLKKRLKELADYKYALEESSIVALTDQKGIISYANDNFCKISKYELEELIGKDHRVINSGFHTKDFMANLWKTIANGKIWRGELKNKAKDGTMYWVDTRIVPFLNKKGKPYQYVVIRVDITERKFLEEELKSANQKLLNNEKRFHALIENNKDMITLSTSNGKIFYISPSVTKIFGYSSKDMYNMLSFDLIHPDDIQQFVEGRKIILETPGKSYNSEIRLLHKKGNWIWCETMLTNMLHEQGINALVSNFRDISEKKKASQAQTESNNLIQTIYAASPDAVIIINTEGIITKWDAKSEALFGWKEQEVRGRELSRIIIPERYREMHEKGMKHYLQTGKGPVLGRVIEIDALKKNGVEFDVSLSITPSFINGEIHFIGFIRDISQKRLIEKQREFDNNNFSALINNTADLMWSVDLNCKLITFNQPFYKLIKLVSGKELAKGDDVFSVILSPEQSDRFKILYARAFAGETFTEIEYIESPVESWSEISYCPIREGDEVIGTACHSRDITERKNAERSMKDERILLRTLIDSLPAIIFAKDIHSQKTLSNRADYEHMGAGSEAEVLGKSDASFFSDDMSRNTTAEEEQIFKTGKGIYDKEEFYEKHGYDSAWFLNSKIPLRNHDNDIIGLIGVGYNITERKKTEENLRKSEKRLNEAQSISHLGNWELNFATGIALWSEEACRIYGLSPKDNKHSYSAWVSFLHPEDLDYVMTAINESKKTFSDTVLNHRIILKDGTIKHIYSKCKFEFDQNGNPVGLHGIAHDVTEEKIAEEKLTQSEAFLSEAQRLAKLGSWNYDVKVDRLTWSEELYNIFDTDKQKFVETHGSFLHLVDEKDRKLALQTSRQTQKTGDPFTIEYGITTPAGEKRTLKEHGYGQKDKKGKVIRLFGTAQDITEQVLSRKKIEASEERYRQIVETSQEGIWLIDENNKTTFVNKRFCEIFGYSVEEMMGKTNFDLMDEEGKAIAEKTIERRKKGLAEDLELVYVGKNGRKIWANVSANPIIGDKGDYLGGLSMLTDITARKSAEIEKEKMTADLIQRNKDLEQFAYIISHNLRAPVANILGATNILSDPGLSEEEKDMLRLGLNKSVMGLDNIVKDLNNILQVKHEINEIKEKICLSELVDNIKNSIKNLIDEDHIKITCDFSEINEFFTLKSYLHSIFYNLIFNSIKYRQQQIPCTIKIKSLQIKNKIELIFTDNGLGIDLQKRGDQVFGLYKRFHTNIEGKGMGLYMVKTQVETLGGKISIKSEVNKGTEFKIEFEI